MKKLLFIFPAILILLLADSLRAQDTFSIVAIDPLTGQVGSAGASCVSGSRILSDVHPGRGAVVGACLTPQTSSKKFAFTNFFNIKFNFLCKLSPKGGFSLVTSNRPICRWWMEQQTAVKILFEWC